MAEDKKWYVMYTAPRAEKKVTQRLEENGLEVFLPMVEEIRQWSDRKKKVQRALFNGYIFVKTTKDRLWESLQVQGAVKFVHFAGNHATVRDQEIETIKRLLETGVAVEVDTGEIEAGEKVKILGGPMQGFEGECVQKGNKDYFIIRIPTIHQNVMVNLPRKYLEVIS
ncbi:UpxY family transcription antiterminator [Litoribacter ruber]|uniref:UpxY family transcription antiterminator n=1 Tax=Litoribacter ruber TaxID=702568 RepID=A0AAP2CG72_9BACT|nr:MULTISPECIES: UpxY family transcription antiterminator [Litoribacter]MBS9522999.1 UpxY family transcription antiterminator [Litoribacter alkaliphilus]MBT0810837.1 UpxY family transcription antiterminator [Litoribacter ruber]